MTDRTVYDKQLAQVARDMQSQPVDPVHLRQCIAAQQAFALEGMARSKQSEAHLLLEASRAIRLAAGLDPGPTPPDAYNVTGPDHAQQERQASTYNGGGSARSDIRQKDADPF